MLKFREKHSEKDPFLCTCGPCKTFWRKNFDRPSQVLYRRAVSRAADTSVIFEATLKRENHPAVLKLGDRVVVQGNHKGYGTVKFVGVLKEDTIAPETYVGLQLDDNIGSTHNGVYNGKRYFYCPRGHGALVKYSDVMRCTPPEKRPPLKGNYMFPSYEDVKMRRKSRALAQGSDPIGLMRSNTDLLGQDQRNLRMKEPHAFVFDKQDIAVKDAMRRELEERQRNKRTLSKQRQDEAGIQTLMQRWKEQFGNNKQAEQMANTLRKLHSAYAKGVEWKRKQESGEKAEEDDTEGTSDGESGAKSSH